MTITIVGLGPGDIDDLSRRAFRTLKQAQTVYLRTSQHGCVSCLPQSETVYHSFDSLYESIDDFETVYTTIVEQLISAAKTEDVIYAVPGDPLVGESTTTRLLEQAQAAGIEVEIINGISFVEPSLKLLGVDALDGLQVLDGINIGAMHHPPINPDYPALLGQVYSTALASEIKLTLMNQYPDDFEVSLIHAAGTEAEIVETLPLYEIDRSQHISHMTSLYIPAMGEYSSFEAFQEIIAHLRAPEGCPWDRKQTHESLRQFLIEEAYEVLEAIEQGDTQSLYEELGDLLLQIVLHTQIAIDDGEFYMTDVLKYVNAKMIRRHPHVWGDVDVEGNPDNVVTNWEAIKKQEKVDQDKAHESMLDSIPRGLPSLLQAHQYQARAAKLNFDWEQVDDVIAKVREEMDEVLAAETDEHRTEEIGDLLFVLVNWARWLGVEPETALRGANTKFYRRFSHIERQVAAQGKQMTDCTLTELDALWDEAKALEKVSPVEGSD
ncbi:MAG: nucleoside triphosphate pyrophosphohydrolase [Anaerolineae bacterium]|nr:nucleoside triphosphate pyrophosphohydrolase [Anaerolineae bacterium]